MGVRLSQYDLSKPVLDTIIEETIKNKDWISDSLFDQIVNEYDELDERVMDQMYCTDKGTFTRHAGKGGWSFESNEQ